ncbi:hypothetical protein [Dactylosporangium sp. NPDC050588]|uniref:hypothetical protein n=1 Tax=Dactylosporangium sp. NPDC050588 TaxID=3157211 RepID=UPI0033D8F1D8
MQLPDYLPGQDAPLVDACPGWRTSCSGPRSWSPSATWGLLPTDPVHLLLALPAFGKGENGGGDPAPVAAALRAVGATTAVDEVAAELLARRSYGR